MAVIMFLKGWKFPKISFFTLFRRNLNILGIETSCDDTAAAVLNENRQVLGECSRSQQSLHNKFGGIVPELAQNQHAAHIESVVKRAVENSGLSFADLDAIAVTTRPGLVLSLRIGTKHALQLCKQHQKPLIKVHHMRAHALTATFTHPQLTFPFLCLLISGGHSLLSLVKGMEHFEVLGSAKDSAVGDVIDKVARRLCLQHFRREFENLSGGRAMDLLAAESANPLAFEFPPVMATRSCDFSFSGLRSQAERKIAKLEEEQGKAGGCFLDGLEDFCASFQHAVLSHLAVRVQRAIEILDFRQEMSPETHSDPDWRRRLVVSGGCASNSYIRQGLEFLLAEYDYELVVPPPTLCTDNGIMIAWNGLQTLQESPNSPDIVQPAELPEYIWVDARSPLGEDRGAEIAAMRWKLKKPDTGLDQVQAWLPLRMDCCDK